MPENLNKLIINTRRDMIVAGADALDLGSIFGLFLAETGKAFLEHIGHYFMFPFAALASCLRAYFAWKNKKLEKGQNGSAAHFALEAFTAVFVTVAVIGSFFWSVISTLISPAIFTGVLGGKTLFHFGAAGYYALQAHKVRTTAKQNTDSTVLSEAFSKQEKNYSKKMRSHLASGIAGVFATAAVVLVMIIAKPAFIFFGGICGVVGGACMAVIAAYRYKTFGKPNLGASFSFVPPSSNSTPKTTIIIAPKPKAPTHSVVTQALDPDHTDSAASTIMFTTTRTNTPVTSRRSSFEDTIGANGLPLPVTPKFLNGSSEELFEGHARSPSAPATPASPGMRPTFGFASS